MKKINYDSLNDFLFIFFVFSAFSLLFIANSMLFLLLIGYI